MNDGTKGKLKTQVKPPHTHTHESQDTNRELINHKRLTTGQLQVKTKDEWLKEHIL